MNRQPIYKSLKVTFETWQIITRLIARTGEPRTRLIERVMKAEEERLENKAVPTEGIEPGRPL